MKDALAHEPGLTGIDEVGRGPLAGPVVAAAVCIRSEVLPAGLRDSKKLTADQRERLDVQIRRCCAVGVGVAEVEEIDRLNILHAALLAMRRAFEQLGEPPRRVIVDGTHRPRIATQECVAEPKADARYACVAAASIVAKVMRDRIMRDLAREFPDYGFERHFGYPTPEHLERLRALGPCPIHRRSFRPVAEAMRPSPAPTRLKSEPPLSLFPELLT